MEAVNPEMNANDYADFEQRVRSHTWPQRQLVHLELGTVAVSTADPSLSPGVNAQALLFHDSSASISATSSASLVEALKSNLSLIPDPDSDQKSQLVPKMGLSRGKQGFILCPKKIAFRTQSDMRLSTLDTDNAKFDGAYPSCRSYPSLSRVPGDIPSQHAVDALPTLSLSPEAETHSQAVTHSTLNGSQNVSPASSNAQFSVIKLVSVAGNTSGLLSVASSGEDISDSPISPSEHPIIDDGSVQNITVAPVDPHTASSSTPRAANDNNMSVKALPCSGTQSKITCSRSNMLNKCTSSRVVGSIDLSAAMPYFTAPACATGGPVEEDPEDPGERKPIKRKRVRKRLNGTVSQKKPNPWGEESYSDLIAKALKSTSDGRMRLNEIYNWFASNVPYFGNRTSQEQSAGWKVEFSLVPNHFCSMTAKKVNLTVCLFLSFRDES
uniref:Fork-head domain-containing protein n=1 Tax=Setaria digitata TaxID=48799 RepID=A0A915PUC3_9BILA